VTSGVERGDDHGDPWGGAGHLCTVGGDCEPRSTWSARRPRRSDAGQAVGRCRCATTRARTGRDGSAASTSEPSRVRS
jgi:hypothetical protein